MLRTSPLAILACLAIGLVGGAYLYYDVNVDLFGIGRPDFNALHFNSNDTQVQSDNGNNWVIVYEKATPSIFTGLVRHVSPIRLGMDPFLTHDILVTTGDFANPEIVSTRVSNHHFSWSTQNKSAPGGTINLIHAVPLNEAIYDQLLEIRNGQQAAFSGYEIMRIDAYQKTGEYIGKWEDSGCNSMLVTSVQVQK
ncbi:MAG: hypothetical protein IMZ62_18585 [Chloroflexi bacterium]|nr:hypothetical protein [Chloroflexota bacterium]